MRRVPQQHANSYVRREPDRRSYTRQAALLCCCLLLAVGFIFAAGQQIAAVQYGYKSEELRRERERLIDEQRRLLLQIEESSSPATLERHARQLGLQPARASQIGGDQQAGAADVASGGAEDINRTRRQPGAGRVTGSPAFAGAAAASLTARR